MDWDRFLIDDNLKKIPGEFLTCLSYFSTFYKCNRRLLHRYIKRQCSGSESRSAGSTFFRASRIRILLSASINSKKNIDFYHFVISFVLFIFENDVNVPSKSNKQKKPWKKNNFMFTSWRSLLKNAGSGSVSQRYESADPDPYQNFMDPQHWVPVLYFQEYSF
jgi:hypothetical protein